MDTRGVPAEKITPSFKLILSLSIALTTACIFVYLLHPVFLDYLHYKITDAIVASDTAYPVSNRIAVVDIDENSMTTYGQWPWSRAVLSELLDEITRLGARRIALDLILAEPDRTPANDAVLATTLAHTPVVLGYEFLFNGPKSPLPRQHHPPLALKAVQIWRPASDGAFAGFYPASHVLCNLPRFNEAASSSGFLNGKPDSDGLLRRLPILIRYENALYPNLALAALLPASGSQKITLKHLKGTQAYLTVGPTAIPMDANGNVRIRFPATGHTLQHISAAAILAGAVPDRALKDRIVFVGLQASGLMAAYQTPAGGLLSAVDIQAQLAETIVSGKFIRRPPGVLYGEILLAIVLAVICAVFIARLGFIPAAIISLIGIGGLWETATGIFLNRQILFSPLLPTAVLAVNGSFVMLFKYWIQQKSARVQMRDALTMAKKSEKNLNSIIKTIPNIVFRLDPEGKVTFISPAAGKYHPHPEKMIGMPIQDLIHPDDQAAAAKRLTERIAGKSTDRDFEIRLLIPSTPGSQTGKGTYFSVSAQGLYDEKEAGQRVFLGTQGIARDITRRKQLESRLAQSKKMEAVGSLAAGVAHDLNNILSVLVSYPELILLDLPADSPLREPIQTIQESGFRAAAIVQDMLTIARRGVKTDTILNLNEIVTTYLDAPEIKKILENHPDIRTRADLAADLMNIRGSAIHLSKIIINLVANAAEAMPAGGEIAIITRNRYLDHPLEAYEIIPEGEFVCLSIRDTGIGIASDDLTRIFEPFYSKKKMGRSGSGLGMTVVWSAIKDHSGYVNITSREGEGTRFDIYLPATRDDLEETGSRVVLEDYLGTERILVVDDVPEQRTIAVRMLGKLGYTVTAVGSGEAAVAWVKDHPVDLIVLDMIMPPGIDGLETFQRIRATRPGQKAIIASGYAESERVRRMQDMGAADFVHKPYTLEKIGLAVRKALDQQPDH